MKCEVKALFYGGELSTQRQVARLPLGNYSSITMYCSKILANQETKNESQFQSESSPGSSLPFYLYSYKKRMKEEKV